MGSLIALELGSQVAKFHRENEFNRRVFAEKAEPFKRNSGECIDKLPNLGFIC